MNTFLLGLIVIAYLLTITYLGFKGYKQTKSSKDYLVAGRSVHPFIMAISYGATFISSSAIIGFGGVSANFGQGLMWLAFLNMLIGVIIAFIFFGKKTRRLGHQMDAHTFPEFLGLRFNSKKIQVLAGAIIFISMPLYAAVVLKGGAIFIETIFEINFNLALLIFTLIIAAYVIAGGLKGVMYTDALQGSIMFVSMFVLLIWTYKKIGMGFSASNTELTSMLDLVPEELKKIGHRGWTSMPEFGSAWWYVLVTTLIMGVGIGVLAQPQLVVRFMTVKSDRELNRGIMIGCIFLLATIGVIYTLGPLTNIYFMQTEGKIAIESIKDLDKIIPIYVNQAMPKWFAAIFMLTILSASMSTLSSQFHAMGTSIGRDVYSKLFKTNKNSTYVTRLGITISILISYVICYSLNMSIIARGTAIFFGICAATFLPAYFSSLYWKRATAKAAYISMIGGLAASTFCLTFLHKKEAVALGISKALIGKEVLISKFPWTVIDPIVFALPISVFLIVIVTMLDSKTKALH